VAVGRDDQVALGHVRLPLRARVMTLD
jgi:hypothetical protein